MNSQRIGRPSFFPFGRRISCGTTCHRSTMVTNALVSSQNYVRGQDFSTIKISRRNGNSFAFFFEFFNAHSKEDTAKTVTKAQNVKCTSKACYLNFHNGKLCLFCFKGALSFYGGLSFINFATSWHGLSARRFGSGKVPNEDTRRFPSTFPIGGARFARTHPRYSTTFGI